MGKLIRRKDWNDLLTIPVSDDIRNLIKQCKYINEQLDVIILAVNNNYTFPKDYLIKLRTSMMGILVSYLNFLKKHTIDKNITDKIEIELKALQKNIGQEEANTERNIGSREKYFFALQKYIATYYEFIYSYIYDTLKNAEEEYVKELDGKISEIMKRKLGIIEFKTTEEKKKLEIIKGE